MVVWQGITSGGTAVPVQVDDEGRVVAQGIDGKDGQDGAPGADGPQGPPGPEGPAGADGLWREVNSRLIMPAGNVSVQVGLINLDQGGAATFANGEFIVDVNGAMATPGPVTINDPDNSSGHFFGSGGGAEHTVAADTVGSTPVLSVIKGFGNSTFQVTADGAASFAGSKFTIGADGSLGAGGDIAVYNSGTFAQTARIYSADGDAGFDGKIDIGGSWPNNQTSRIADGAIYCRNDSGPGSIFEAYSGGTSTSNINIKFTASGNANFAGNVTAANISAFSVVLKAAVRNSKSFDELKTAIIEAVTALVPPDVSTMPVDETMPDASTMPADE